MPDVQVEMRPSRNLELEKLRNEGLNLSLDDEKSAVELANKLALLHATYLFYGCGLCALRKICLVVCSTPACSNLASSSSWKDLAYLLGLTYHEIGYIENMHSDCTEMVLKTYAVNEINATIDKIILGLSKLKRYDAISEAKNDLKDLIEFVRREHNIGTEEELVSDDTTLRPSGWEHFQAQLPATLRRNLGIAVFDDYISTADHPRSEENIQQATVIERRHLSRSNCCKRVMLTFAKDGEKTAYNVAAQLRKRRDLYLPFGVLILQEYYDLVEANPIHFITNSFPKVDYIIPIITPQYLKAIEENETPDESTWSTIDTRYVKMIHTLMGNYYLRNACRNDKFRSVIPDEYVKNILKDQRMKRDPVLQAYVTESELEFLAKRIIRRK